MHTPHNQEQNSLPAVCELVWEKLKSLQAVCELVWEKLNSLPAVCELVWDTLRTLCQQRVNWSGRKTVVSTGSV